MVSSRPSLPSESARAASGTSEIEFVAATRQVLQPLPRLSVRRKMRSENPWGEEHDLLDADATTVPTAPEGTGMPPTPSPLFAEQIALLDRSHR